MAGKKFYAVKQGRVPGIYTTWPEAERQVKGFAAARFKGFPSREEAQAWLDGVYTAGPEKKRKPASSRSASSRKRPPTAADIDPAEMKNAVCVYTDGGAIGNPGPGGYGVVIVTADGERELSGGFRHTTNNRMELLAAIEGLKAVEGTRKPVVLTSDSSYLVNGMTKGWAQKWQRNGWCKADKTPALNVDLWQKLLDLTAKMHVRFCWVKGHAGNPYNERCDRLAVAASRGNRHDVDTVYEAGL